MLQDYRRQAAIKPFAPILKDRSQKRWQTEVIVPTNLSLLSISSSSSGNSDDAVDHTQTNPRSHRRDSSSSRSSLSLRSIDLSEPHAKHTELDQYILQKHVYGLMSTRSHLTDLDVDPQLRELFEGSKSASRWPDNDYQARAIRPPPYSQHILQIRQSLSQRKPIQRRSARTPVRMTRAESLKLERQQSASERQSEVSKIRPLTSMPQPRRSIQSQARHSTIPLIKHLSRPRAASDSTFRQSESARSCKVALGVNGPLILSTYLIKQMRQDIQSNRVPAYSKPLNSALLREHPDPGFNRQYKMKRVRRWLDNIIPTDYVQLNDDASNQTTVGTLFNDKLDDETDLLNDEKQVGDVERSYAEAHRVLPLFLSEIDRKLRHRDLLLTRLELDLYAV